MRIARFAGSILLIIFVTVAVSEIFLHIYITNEKYAEEYDYESRFNRYRKSWYGDRFKSNHCSIAEDLITHPHLAFISKPGSGCSIPVNDSGTYGTRNLKSQKEKNEYSILLVGGSVASHMGMLEAENPLEIELNNNYIPPEGKNIFKIYNGSHPAWKMPGTTLMGLMNQNDFDSIIFLDGFNEFVSLFFEKNLWNPSEYIYSVAENTTVADKIGFGGVDRVMADMYSRVPLLKHLRTYNILLKIMITNDQNKNVHYVAYGKGETLESLSVKYVDHVKAIGSFSGSVVFFQPTALIKKKLTAEELKNCGFVCEKDYINYYESFSKLVYSKILKNKIKNFYDLTNIFSEVSEAVYADAAHLKNEKGDIGMELLGKKMALGLSQSLGLKHK